MRKNRVIAATILVALAMAGCSSGLKPKPVELSGQTTTLDLGLPPAALNAPITDKLPGNTSLHVDVTFKVSSDQLNQLSSGLKSKGGMKSSATPNAIGTSLGVTAAQLQEIENYFASGDIKATPSKTQTSVTFTATADQVGRLLQTDFVDHKLNGRTYFTPDPKRPPKVPKEIAPYILAVTGLDSYGVATTKGAVASSAPRISPAAAPGTMCVRFRDEQLATAPKVAHSYGYDRMWQNGWYGQGMTINLVEQDGFDPADISAYQRCVGSSATVQTVAMGSAPRAEGETTLDMEMISGLAPQAKIIDYQEPGESAGTWSALNETLQALIDNNAQQTTAGSVVSISLGAPESYLTQSIFAAINQDLQLLTAAEHMTVFVSSGDCAAFSDGVLNGTPDVQFPASDPWVVAVGGTQMTFAATGAAERVWSDGSKATCQNSWGSGGGVSRVFGRSWFQVGPGVDNRFSTGNTREVPDVAATAINIPVYYQGKWGSWGGTSAAAPIWAAGMSLMNQGMVQRRHGFYYSPRPLYWLANNAVAQHPFLDVVNGSNLYYPATAGYDNATGLGAPWWPGIFTALANV